MSPGATRDLYVFSRGLLFDRHLRRMLALAGYTPRLGLPRPGDDVGVWGRGTTARRGIAIARRCGARIVTLEDAFLRSVRPARAGGGPPAGLLIDRQGVHFDPERPSDLETLLSAADFDDALLDRARGLIDSLAHWHVGKYAPADPEAETADAGHVLLLDQARGDASLCGAGREDFRDMLAWARRAFPNRRVLLRSHPETGAGGRGGHFGAADIVPGVTLAPPGASLWRLARQAHAVVTWSSLGGFEALLAGAEVHVRGMPFYAGWGATRDRAPHPRRHRRLTPVELAAAAYILAPVWFDARTDTATTPEAVARRLAAEARAWREDRDGWVMPGMRRWKRPVLRRAFGGRVRFPRTVRRPRRPVAVWGTAPAPPGALRIEDGFLRSRGLGARLVAPVSLVVDAPGLHYDPRTPSRLDRLIAASPDLPDAELRRAEALAGRIAALGLTKYDIAAVSAPPGPRGVLVVGQVPSDASVRLGAPGISGDAPLIEAARAAMPGARILWKPHPDILAGLRTGSAIPPLPVDEILTGSAADALARADEVWTLTSTLGFEALLRGIPVTCAGLPFYAGWGLTRDLLPAPAHRRARPSLAGLVHAVLIGYPRYFDPASGTPLSPEDAVTLLAASPDRRDGAMARLLPLARRFRPA